MVRHNDNWLAAMHARRGVVFSESHRAALSAANKGKKFSQERVEKMKGRAVSDETREKLRRANLGKRQSEEACLKKAVAMRGRVITSEWRAKISAANKGKIPSEESRKRMSESHVRRVLNDPSSVERFMSYGGRSKRVDYKGISFRSSWEVDVAKYLDRAGVEWVYEPKRFMLLNGKTYLPDFHIPAEGKYIEVKGVLKKVEVDKMNAFVRAGHALVFVDDPLKIDLSRCWVGW